MTQPLIHKKMTSIMKDIGVIGKNSTNTQQGFKFRGIDSMMNNLYPILVKYEVFMTPRCVTESHELKDVTRSSGKVAVDKHVSIQMEYDFIATDGSKVTVGPIPAEGLDGGDKATNKALSAALKYALIQTFTVPTEDMEEADLTSPEIGISKAAKIIEAGPAQTTEATVTKTTTKASGGFKRPTAKTAVVNQTLESSVSNGTGTPPTEGSWS